MTRFETISHSRPDHAQTRLQSFGAILEQLFLPERDPLHIFLILGGLTLLGLILRLLDMNKQIGYDEAYTFVQFASRPFKHILADYSAPNNHIFHTILVGIAYRLLGGQPWILRLPAFLAGVLMVPAMYITARRFFSRHQALTAAGLAAVTPLFINYSVNGRGYTLLVLFALLLANFAGILVRQSSKSALLAYVVTAALGFYTIPVFLYPMAGISLWVVATHLFTNEPQQDASRLRKLGLFLGACLVAGLLTFMLYAPVIFFGSGLSSIVGNEIVQSLSWSTFLENLDPRLNQAWSIWMKGIRPALEYLFLFGFLISVFFYRRVSNQKLPMQVLLVFAMAVLLVFQRVTPLPRIWIYLEAFFLMFAAAGLVWLVDLALRRTGGSALSERLLSIAIPVVFLGAFAQTLIGRAQNPVFSDRDLLPEAYAADYIAEHIQPEDAIVAIGPVDIQTAYYLNLHGIPFDRFYKRDQPVAFQNALVMLRQNSKYKTPESVADFFKLDQTLDLSAAELVFEYASVQVYSIPTK
jgi:hypothetical protein